MRERAAPWFRRDVRVLLDLAEDAALAVALAEHAAFIARDLTRMVVRDDADLRYPVITIDPPKRDLTEGLLLDAMGAMRRESGARVPLVPMLRANVFGSGGLPPITEADLMGLDLSARPRDCYALPSSYIDEHPELRPLVAGTITEADMRGFADKVWHGPRPEYMRVDGRQANDEQTRAYLAGLVSCTNFPTISPSAYAVIRDMPPPRRPTWLGRLVLRALRAWDRFWTWAMGLTGYDPECDCHRQCKCPGCLYRVVILPEYEDYAAGYCPNCADGECGHGEGK